MPTKLDNAAIGREYADNLIGEPAVSKCLHAMADEIDRLRHAELDYNDGLTLTAVRELLARKTTPELIGTLRDLAADYRFDLMPAKFRCVMQEAANRLEKCLFRRWV